MIDKERLIDLIKQGKTVYYVDSEEYDGCREVIELNENENTSIKPSDNAFDIIFCSDSLITTLKDCELAKFYETKEDAEFAYKYENISRIDYLNLPLYKDFIKNYQTLGENLIEDDKCIMFTSKTQTYSLYATDDEIWVGQDGTGKRIFNDELNQENYEKACEICRKLFLGE